MRINVFVSMVALAVGAVAIAVSAEGAQEDRTASFRQIELFGDVLSRIEADYVSDTDQAELIEAAIEGMLTSLDPHSAYHSPDAYEDLRVTTRGEYGGLGMEVVRRDQYITIVSPIADTPAERAGLRTNDRIIAVDGDGIVGISVDEAVALMRGAVGDPVTITIAREADDPFDVTLVRDTIPLRTVATRIENGVPYMRIAGFNERTTEMVHEGLTDLQDEFGAELPGLILDMRFNPGGLLDQAIGVTDVFLDGGEVVSTRTRDPRDTQRYNARPGDRLDGVPIVILINEGTASAAEIVAGALQDRERAELIGMTSFGKGSIQTIIPLRGGRDGALRLTTGRYYTPAGRSIQATGIIPDQLISAWALEEDAESPVPQIGSEADLDGALENENGDERETTDIASVEQPPADWPEDEDYQLHRAVELLSAAMETQQASLRP
ncbi:S41 family peptidase [Maricaulis sp.]|jgi:carboxyl-terminal processing protease|uniref:S41 family peptidase n=1 Tax=Maricaulis sp. TaxID=1486257 RepID=UPI0025D0DB62|nr:S41 family peptidase [Maricaulis sp.]MDF1767878.1 S41 family peptidase [Maricaulis sp.]